MHINKWMAAAAAGLLLFFGYLGYRELIFDDTAAARAAIQNQISSLPTANNRKPPEYYGHKRAEIALQEYAKNVVESPRGCNCGPEIDKYTENNPGQWCTMFASWVANQAGSPLWDERTNSWRYSNSRLFLEHLKKHGTFFTKEEVKQKSLKPQTGDFVVFWRGQPEDNLGHIDIVINLGSKDGTAGLVGGNLRDRIAYREDFPYLSHYGFLGFGRPEKLIK